MFANQSEALPPQHTRRDRFLQTHSSKHKASCAKPSLQVGNAVKRLMKGTFSGKACAQLEYKETWLTAGSRGRTLDRDHLHLAMVALQEWLAQVGAGCDITRLRPSRNSTRPLWPASDPAVDASPLAV